MKKAKYIIILALIPLMSFAQYDIENSITTNEISLKRMTFNEELFTEPKSETNLQELKSFNDSIKKTIFHWDVSIGTFIPTNKAKFLGVKPTFGASVGFIHKRMTYDFTFDIRFGKTKNKYQLADGSITDHYFGGYVGIDVLRDIWNNNKNQILLLGGIGLDVFEIEPGVYDDPTFLETLLFGYQTITIEEATNIYSPNINFGLMYRFYFNNKNYFGIRYKYNIVDYNSRKIHTDVTGNFHSITLNFGGFIKDF